MLQDPSAIRGGRPSCVAQLSSCRVRKYKLDAVAREEQYHAPSICDETGQPGPLAIPGE
jgi:hypothetical protein